jgi:hypothetical protein
MLQVSGFVRTVQSWLLGVRLPWLKGNMKAFVCIRKRFRELLQCRWRACDDDLISVSSNVCCLGVVGNILPAEAWWMIRSCVETSDGHALAESRETSGRPKR